LIQQLPGGHFLELGQVLDEGVANAVGRARGIGMGAAERLGDDFVGDAELDEVRRRELEGGGGFVGVGAVFSRGWPRSLRGK
jgi:hypothetical protein